MTAQNIPVASVHCKRPVSDEELVERVLEDDTWAKEALYRKYVDPITSVTAKLLRRQTEVEDVVQDTFIQAFRDLHQLKSPSKLRPWLTSIAIRRVHSKFKKRKWQKLLGIRMGPSFEDERLCSQVRIQAPQETMAEISLLDGAFDRMPLSDKTCWVLRYLEGYRLREIVKITGVSLATVKRRIANANHILEDHIQQRGAHD